MPLRSMGAPPGTSARAAMSPARTTTGPLNPCQFPQCEAATPSLLRDPFWLTWKRWGRSSLPCSIRSRRGAESSKTGLIVRSHRRSQTRGRMFRRSRPAKCRRRPRTKLSLVRPSNLRLPHRTRRRFRHCCLPAPDRATAENQRASPSDLASAAVAQPLAVMEMNWSLS